MFPYFFSIVSAGQNNLIYKWNMEGKNIITSAGQNTLTFRKEKDQVGTSNVSVSIKAPGTILQSAKTAFSLVVGGKKQNEGNIFNNTGSSVLNF